MPPQSRGPPVPPGFQSKSTPNLPTRRSLTSTQLPVSANATPTTIAAEQPKSPTILTSPSEAASIEDFSLDADPPDISSGSDDSEEEDGHVANLPPRPVYGHQYSRSHTYLAPSSFAPPFYNRPPTPLPPSPSLTSLLRPNFSSQNSRPSTPDPSSDEGGTSALITTGTQTPNSAAASTLTSSFRKAKPIPRASPKVPTYEYYGFTLYLTSSLAFIVYLLWSYLPSPFLHQLGIYYYPNRWWSLAIPAWLVMLVLYIYVALASYNTGYLTLPLNSVECLVDEAANVAVVDENGQIVRNDRPSWRSPSPERVNAGTGSIGRKGKGRHGGYSRKNSAHDLPLELDWRNLWNEGTDAVMDIPIGGVCEILYGMGRDEAGSQVDLAIK